MKSEFDDQVIYDLCIIGSGPAGIITALEFSRLDPEKRVLLIEYGIKEQPVENDLDNSIQNTNPINHHDPYECTNKGLGGSSATWGGRCVMYDEVDFIDRPALSGGCTWDSALFDETKKYIPAAAAYFECGDPVFNLNDMPEFAETKIADNFREGVVTDSVVERWSMPTRFGTRYEKELAERENLTLLMGYEARDFSEPDESGNVSLLKVRNISTKNISEISAKKFVLSAGTQETTRILLRNLQLFNSLQEVPQALGKYYQGHLSGKIASVVFKGEPKNVDYGFLRNADGSYMRRRFQFTSKYLVDNNLLNTAIWLDNPLYFDPVHKSGAMSFMYLAMITPILGKKLAPPAIAHSITKGEVKGVGKHILNIIKDFPGSLITPASIFYKRYCLKRKLPGVFLYSPKNNYALHFHSEQIPFEGNRMELGADGEKLIIHYELTDTDINSVIKLHDTLDKWLRECNCGELQYWFKKDELFDAIKKISKDGIHQSGTTRIADSSKEGVVDRDLRLWGTKNIFVCSSSVFPTSGQANPTFYLGVFAVRLANYLNKI
jgi:choline dehydrogenase-like flavoprotein